eukprot:TRINITY_DN572_c0_g1_i1.p1 TRINITY_DN572_c0_g1~~TRINITY_DN572_c0_g1_i1.p1  ORF type:complete len:1069 (+),score=93.84 TRINITY_DN572_c0_g1_i1:2156-5362(+)
MNHPGVITRPSSNTSPDVIFTDRSFDHVMIGTIDSDEVEHKSDHLPLIAEINTLRDLSRPTPSKKPRILWDFQTADWDGFREDIKKRLRNLNHKKGATYLSNVLRKGILEAAKNNIRRRVKFRGPQSRRWRRETDETMEDKGKHLTTKLEQASSFTYAFRKIREMDKQESNIVEVQASSDKDLAERFMDKFLMEGTSPVLPVYRVEEYEPIINMTELVNAINRTPLGKAPGPDGIHPIMLKKLPPEAHRLLLHIINKSWSEGSVPKTWKEGTIRPVHKPGKPKSDINSYRPITLTSVVGKVTERIIYDRLAHWLTINDKLSHIQAGFRRGRNTCEQISVLLNALSKAKNRCEKAIMVSFDFSAAFDRINHDILIRKMYNMGIPNQYINWVVQFLSQRVARVFVNGTFSDYRKVRRGVPQGSILGPLLYVIYVNDLCEAIDVDWATSALYADDTAVVVSGTAGEAIMNAQKIVNIVGLWSLDNEMVLSTSKTFAMAINFSVECRITFNGTRRYTMYTNKEEVISQLSSEDPDGISFPSGESIVKVNGEAVFTRQQLLSSLAAVDPQGQFRIDTAMIMPMRDSLRYLGIIIDKELWFTEQTGKLVTSIRRGASLMRNLFKYRLNHHTLTMIKDLYIMSKVSYALESYGRFLSARSVKLLDIELNKVSRLVTGCEMYTQMVPLRWEAGILPMRALIDKQTWTAFFRNKSMPWCPGSLSLTQSPWANNIPKALREKGLVPLVRPDSLAPWVETPEIKISPSFGFFKSGDAELDKERFLAYAENLPQASLSIYVDGSYSPDGRAGAAMVSGSKEPTSAYAATLIGADCSYKAEQMALVILAKRLCCNRNTLPPGLIRIFTDSKSNLDELNMGRVRQRKVLPLLIIDTLRQIGRKIHLQFIPAHVGMDMHDTADRLAKEASLKRVNGHTVDGDLPVFKTMIKRHCRKRLIDALDPSSEYFKITRKKGIPRFPAGMSRDDEKRVTSFRAGSHYLLRGRTQSQQRCRYCTSMKKSTQHHLLLECPGLNEGRAMHLGGIIEKISSVNRPIECFDLLMKMENLRPVASFIHWLELISI